MSDFDQIVPWLYRFDQSNIKSAKALMDSINDVRIDASKHNQLMEITLAAAEKIVDPLEEAEVKTLCARDYWSRRRSDETLVKALSCLTSAVNIYGNKSEAIFMHRCAVTLWLRGIVQWEMNHNYEAYDDWKNACVLFNKLAEDSAKRSAMGNKDERVLWYRERLEWMRVSLACTAEEAYTWLNELEPGCLGRDLVEVRNWIVDGIKKPSAINVNQQIRNLMELLARRSNLCEKAEAFLECGLAKYHLQDYGESIQFLQMSVSTYKPDSHQQMVARWILGIVMMKDIPRFKDGLQEWVICIEDAGRLEERAHWANDRQRVEWYGEKLAIMKQAKMAQLALI
jgi:tetratricopeptide (TPR) repeat protein